MKVEISDNCYLNRHLSDQNHNLGLSNLFKELNAKLTSTGYPETSYCLGENQRNDCLVLTEDGEFWSVFYMERGVRFSPAFFVDIDDAVHFFLWKLTNGRVTL